MFIIDMSNIGLPQQNIVMAQNASPSSSIPTQLISKIVLQEPWIIANDISPSPGTPTSFAVNLTERVCGELLEFEIFKKLNWTSATCKVVEIVTQPKYGSALESEGDGVYRYTPTHGLLGKDQIQFIIEGIDGRRVFVTLPIYLKTINEAYSGVDPSQNNLGVSSTFTLSFADLPGGAVGQIVGEGFNATITLDTNAADHNWFTNTTPADNSEFLPTSNPLQVGEPCRAALLYA